MNKKAFDLRELMKDAPPMAAYYQRLAFVNDAKSLRKARAKDDDK